MGEGTFKKFYSHELQLMTTLTPCIGCLILRSEQLSAFEASMQLLGLQQPLCTAQSHERLVQVSHVCPVVSVQPVH